MKALAKTTYRNITQAQSSLDENHAFNPAEGGYILDVTGRKQAFFTLWQMINYGIEGVPPRYAYVKNVALDFCDAVNAMLDLQRSHAEQGQPVGVLINDDETIDYQELRKQGIVTHGKYKGLHLAEVAAKDFRYLVWLAGITAPWKKKLRAAAKAVVTAYAAKNGMAVATLRIPRSNATVRAKAKALGAVWQDEAKTWDIVCTPAQLQDFQTFIIS